MNQRPVHRLLAGILVGMTFSCGAAAEVAEPPDRTEFMDDIEKTITDIATDGRWDGYLSGYARHSRDTYSDKRISHLNEKAWGIGFGKTLRNSRGNDESLYALVLRDSNENLQWSAGYSHQWIFPVASSGLEIGAGVSTLLISRKDWAHRVPFPAILPVFSVGSQDVKITGTWVPRISTRKGKGNVTLLVLKTTF